MSWIQSGHISDRNIVQQAFDNQGPPVGEKNSKTRGVRSARTTAIHKLYTVRTGILRRAHVNQRENLNSQAQHARWAELVVHLVEDWSFDDENLYGAFPRDVTKWVKDQRDAGGFVHV